MNCDLEKDVSGKSDPARGSVTHQSSLDGKGLKKVFQNAVNKNKIIHKIQVLQEEKDHVEEQELNKAHQGALSFKERFQRSRPNSICDPVEMIPASDVPFLTETPASPNRLTVTAAAAAGGK